MSRHSINATTLGLAFQIVLTCLVIRSSTKVVDLLGLAPIYSSRRSFLSLVSLDILFVTIASKTFTIILSRVISLYTPSFIQSSFYSFLSTTIVECLNALGQYTILKQAEKSLAKVSASYFLYFLSRRFSIQLGPRALLLGSLLRIPSTSFRLTLASIQNQGSSQVFQISLRSASLRFRKKCFIRIAAFPSSISLLYSRSNRLGKYSSQCPQFTPSLAYLAIFYTFLGSSITSLISLLQARFYSLLIILLLIQEALRYYLQFYLVLLALYSLLFFLASFIASLYSQVYTILI